jgi:hypothetical protein
MSYFAVLSRNLIGGNEKKEEKVLFSCYVTQWILEAAVLGIFPQG